MSIVSKVPAVQKALNRKALNARPTTPEPRVSGVGTEWYIRLKSGDVWRKRGTRAEMERLGKWLAEATGSEVEFIQPTASNTKFKVGDEVFVKGGDNKKHKITYVFGDGSVQLDNSGTASFKPMFLTLATVAKNWNYKNNYQFFCIDPSMSKPCILSGWDYKEDAQELKSLKIPFKIVSGRTLEQKGIDPNDAASWKKNRSINSKGEATMIKSTNAAVQSEKVVAANDIVSLEIPLSYAARVQHAMRDAARTIRGVKMQGNDVLVCPDEDAADEAAFLLEQAGVPRREIVYNAAPITNGSEVGNSSGIVSKNAAVQKALNRKAANALTADDGEKQKEGERIFKECQKKIAAVRREVEAAKRRLEAKKNYYYIGELGTMIRYLKYAMWEE